jgi:hypothetical protein
MAAEISYHANALTPLGRPNQFPSTPGDETPGDGEVFGALNTVAAYGAPVTFAVTKQPTNGTVVVDPNGFYHYTPNAALAAAGGFDSFTVTATDARFHLENLLGMPGHQTPMTVPVTVLPATPAIPDSVPTQRTQAQTGFPTYTYTVVNNSSATQTFGNVVKNEGNVLAFPAVGTALNSGQSAIYQVRSERIPFTEIKQTVSSGSGPGAAIPPVLLDIYDFSSPPNVQWFASCTPAAACSITPGNGGTIRLLDLPGTVLPVQESDTATRDYIAQSLLSTPQPNVTFYQRDPAMADAMAPGDLTGKGPHFSPVPMVATIGQTTYVENFSSSVTLTPSENAFINWYNNCKASGSYYC